MAIASINPTTGKTLETYSALTSEQIEQALTQAQAAFLSYPEVPFAQRKQWMHRAADGLLARKDDFGRTMTLEMGKTLKSAIAEVEKCAWVCQYYADEAEGFLQDEPAKTDASESYVRFLPIGVLLAVMPWNYPFWQVFRAAAPALMTGNPVLLKHASNVPHSALAIAEIFTESGFPPAMFQTLLIGPEPDRINHCRSQSKSRHPHRQRPSRISRCRRCRQAHQKSSSRTGRQRSVYCLAQCELGRCDRHCRHRPPAQQRPVLHRRQTLYPSRRYCRRL